jgi:hypothetical protein
MARHLQDSDEQNNMFYQHQYQQLSEQQSQYGDEESTNGAKQQFENPD